jgi:hypothetical protein
MSGELNVESATLRQLLASLPEEDESCKLLARDPTGRDLGGYLAAPGEKVSDIVQSIADRAGLPAGSFGLYCQGANGAVRLDPGKTLGDSLAEHNLDPGTLSVVLAPELLGNFGD